MSHSIKVTFPDGVCKEFQKSTTGLEIARSISNNLAKKSAAILVNEKLADINLPIEQDADIKIITIEDQQGLEILRHTTTHVMAFAVQKHFPNCHLAIGPVIENGFYYDFGNTTIAESDFEKIEKSMQEIIRSNLPNIRKEVSKKEALEILKNQPYKIELINSFDENEIITIYQMGEGEENFIDLCRGPHVPFTGMIKAFKLLKTSACYWKNDQNNNSLRRVYGTAFSHEKQLKNHLKELEKAEQRDHNKLGRSLDIFTNDENVGKGLPLLTPRGTTLKKILQRFIEDEEQRRGYQFTNTPFMAKSDLYKISGHWQHYKEDMFVVHVDDEELALRPMTCPFHFALYNQKHHSYRDLPIRYAETSTLFRNESSGEMHGLIRVRQFTLSDGHIICREDQLKEEFKKSLDLLNYVLQSLGLEDYHFRFSKWDETKKEKYIDDKESWHNTEKIMKSILDELNLEYVEVKGEAAFYGPKLDIQMKNVHGKEDTILTVQIDFALPTRFKMSYVDETGEKKTPLVIHRSSIGCYERTIALLIEKYEGKFPLWLAPEQIAILSVSDKFNGYAKEVEEKFRKENFRVLCNFKNEPLKKKIKEMQLKKIPLMFIIGSAEQQNQSVSIRLGDGKTFDNFSTKDLIEILKKNISNKDLQEKLFLQLT